MMSVSRDEVLALTLTESIETLSTFYGQESLKNLPGQLREKRRGLKLILQALAILRRSKVGVAIVFAFLMFTFPRQWFCGERKSIYVVSLTKNNSRAIERLRTLNPMLQAALTANSRGMPILTRIKAMKLIWTSADLLVRQGASDPFVFFNQICVAVCHHLFFEDLEIAQPRVVITANDHSAPTVALFGLARALGIKTCYVQHGQVTDSFPPLNYDLAILLNSQAKRAYEASARRQNPEKEIFGQICVLSEYDQAPAEISMPSEPLTLCIALSYFLDTDKLRVFLKDLVSEPFISKIIVSQHPRCLKDLGDFCEKRIEIAPIGTPAKEIVKLAGVCVVSNSGVALEYLHLGCPTFYKNLERDTPEDYYGFVSSGVLPRYSKTALENIERSTQFFDEHWKYRMSAFDPTFRMSPKDARDIATKKLLDLIEAETP